MCDKKNKKKWENYPLGDSEGIQRMVGDSVFVIYWSRPGVVRFMQKWIEYVDNNPFTGITMSHNNYKSFDSAKRAVRKIIRDLNLKENQSGN